MRPEFIKEILKKSEARRKEKRETSEKVHKYNILS